MTIQNLRGTRDFYPEDMAKRQGIYDAWSRALETFGYRYYDAPILESFELYASKSSAEIIEQQSYVFEDRGGRKLVVRPEMTPTVARMVAAKQNELPRVLRWYTVANCWRYERPQKGRLRNFFQLNVDMFGSDSAQADAEIISTGFSVLDELQIPRGAIKARISDRTILDVIFNENETEETKRSKLLSLMDRRAKMEPEEFIAALTELGGENLATELNDFMNLSGDSLPDTPVYARVREVFEILTELGYGDDIVFDPSIIRGFDYYTGIVFEFFDTSGKFGRSVFGGGRYDKLVEGMGGQTMPAVGYAVSAVTIEQVFESFEIESPRVEYAPIVIVPFSENEEGSARELGVMLRSGGKQTIVALPPYDFKKQFKYADKIGSKYVILLAPDEMKDGKVLLKNMETGEQQEVPLESISEVIS